MLSEVLYLVFISVTVISLFFIEAILRKTGLVVFRYFTAVMYSFYVMILPIVFILLLIHPNPWQLFQPLTQELLLVAAITVGFYLYSIIRLLGFPNKQRNMPEVYHHIVFAAFMVIVLFIPAISLMIFAWFYLQQIAIIPYYINYIFPLKSEAAQYRWYVVDTIIFFFSKIILIVALLIYTCFNFTLAYERPGVFFFSLILFSVSLLFNVYWLLLKIPKVARFSKKLKNSV